jgi:predicted RNA methylase
MDIKEERALGLHLDKHWYYVAKGRAMMKFLDKIKSTELLDVGAGSGIFARQLTRAGFCEKVLCVDPNYANEKVEACEGIKIEYKKNVGGVKCNLILMMDVLEHVTDDVQLLKKYTENLSSGDHMFITVPAFNFLWSGHDVYLEHKRRYTIKSVENAVRAAGMIPVKSRYFFGVLFPVVAVIRLFGRALLKIGKKEARSDLKPCPVLLNTFLVLLHDFERITLFRINKIFGLSVFCLCRKI